MTKETVTDFDASTGEAITRPATADEIAQWAEQKAQAAKEAELKAEAEAAKEAAQAKLAALGLNTDDLKALGL
jgi:hypothetical protein